MSRAVQEGCIASCVRYFLLPDRTHTNIINSARCSVYRKGIAALKNKKAAGIDDILLEQRKNLGPKAHE